MTPRALKRTLLYLCFLLLCVLLFFSTSPLFRQSDIFYEQRDVPDLDFGTSSVDSATALKLRYLRPMHIYIPAVGWRSKYSVIMLINSILESHHVSRSLFPRPIRPIQFHILTEDENKKEFISRFQFSQRKDFVGATFYDTQLAKDHCSIESYEGDNGGPMWKENLDVVLSKLCLDKILDESVDVVLILDVDMLVIDDIEELWKMGISGEEDAIIQEDPNSATSPSIFSTPKARIFKPRFWACGCKRINPPLGSNPLSEWRRKAAVEFQKNPPFGLTEEMTYWYQDKTMSNRKRILACGEPCRGINSGVMVQDLRVLRSIKWTDFWKKVIVKDRVPLELRDQDILNFMFSKFPLGYRIHPRFNIQLGHMPESTLDRVDSRRFGAVDKPITMDEKEFLSGKGWVSNVRGPAIIHGNAWTFEKSLTRPWGDAFWQIGSSPNCIASGFRIYVNVRLGILMPPGKAHTKDELGFLLDCLLSHKQHILDFEKDPNHRKEGIFGVNLAIKHISEAISEIESLTHLPD